MASFRYKLRNKAIQIVFSYGRGKLFRTTTGFTVSKESNWNDNGQKIKEVLSELGASKINIELVKLKAHFETSYQTLLTKGEEINNHRLKEIFSSYGNTAVATLSKKAKEFFELFEDFITYSQSNHVNGRKLSHGTIKTYKTTKETFRRFESDTEVIQFSNIDIKFYNKFLCFCEENEYSKNYTGKLIKVLKTFLNYARDNHNAELSINYIPSKFVVLKEEVNEIYLNNDELKILFAKDLSSLGERYERARDIFLIGAFTGLRVSDFNKLTNENLVEYDGQKFFEVLAKKTQEEIIIPITGYVLEIIKRNNGIPGNMPEQTINKLIKVVGEYVEFFDEVIIKKTKGGKLTEKKKFKYELIKTHTARRSFCTNAYLGGLDSLSIMAISGHTTEKNFLNYIKVSKREHAQRIAEHPYFKGLKP